MQFNEIRIETPPEDGEMGCTAGELRRMFGEITKEAAQIMLLKSKEIKELVRFEMDRQN